MTKDVGDLAVLVPLILVEASANESTTTSSDPGPTCDLQETTLVAAAASTVPSAAASRTVSRTPSVLEPVALVAAAASAVPSATASRAVNRAPSVLAPAAVAVVTASAAPSAVPSRAVSRVPSVLEPAAVAAVTVPAVPSAVPSRAVSRAPSVLAPARGVDATTSTGTSVAASRSVSRAPSVLAPAAMAGPTLAAPSAVASRAVSRAPSVLVPATALGAVAASAAPSAVASRTVSRAPSVLVPTTVLGAVAAAAAPSAVPSRAVSRAPSTLEPWPVDAVADGAAAAPSALASRKVSRAPSVVAVPPSAPPRTVSRAVSRRPSVLDPANLAAALTVLARRSLSRAASQLDLSQVSGGVTVGTEPASQLDLSESGGIPVGIGLVVATAVEAKQADPAAAANLILSGALRELEELMLRCPDATSVDQIKAAMHRLEDACAEVFVRQQAEATPPIADAQHDEVLPSVAADGGGTAREDGEANEDGVKDAAGAAEEVEDLAGAPEELLSASPPPDTLTLAAPIGGEAETDAMISTPSLHLPPGIDATDGVDTPLLALHTPAVAVPDPIPLSTLRGGGNVPFDIASAAVELLKLLATPGGASRAAFQAVVDKMGAAGADINVEEPASLGRLLTACGTNTCADFGCFYLPIDVLANFV